MLAIVIVVLVYSFNHQSGAHYIYSTLVVHATFSTGDWVNFRRCEKWMQTICQS